MGEEKCEEKAIAWCKLVEESLTFTLAEETEVSLGIIVNLTGQSSFGITAFKLEGMTNERLTPVIPTGIDDITPSQPAPGSIYNIKGQMLEAPQKGINIIDNKKVLKK